MAEPSCLLGKLEIEVEIKASAEKFHHMFAERPHHISKATPGHIKGCVICTKGNGAKSAQSSPGTELHGEPKVAKDIIEAVDRDKNLFKMRVIEGDLMKEYKNFVLTIQATPKHEGSGSIVHWHIEYEKISEEVSSSLQKCPKGSTNISLTKNRPLLVMPLVGDLAENSLKQTGSPNADSSPTECFASAGILLAGC
ncbi:hypothetical protein F2Q69_00020487 [Brassica cretica]|uniref:Bet v I/Major latex protein domain-containing protein n=1 Tax=Brassica cretica TaxID=69181 RepID=A0A8S9QT98_BRACR|nr:hypothetical protein F2Q69_00020487 [Brassica cretica]